MAGVTAGAALLRRGLPSAEDNADGIFATKPSLTQIVLGQARELRYETQPVNLANFSLFILLGAFWGGSFIAIKIVLDDFPPFFAATARLALATMFLASFAALRRSTVWVPRKDMGLVWLTGFFSLGLPFSLLFWGEQRVSAGLAGILNGSTPLWIALLGPFFLPERGVFSWRKAIGLSLGVIGLMVIFLPSIQFQATRSELLGTVTITGMAICYAIGALLNRKLATLSTPPPFFANLVHQNFAAFLFMLAVSLFFEGLPKQHLFAMPTAWTATLYLSFFSTAVATAIYLKLIKEWGAIRAGSVAYLIPLMALLWDFLIFGHIPKPTEAWGVGLILIGIILVQWPAQIKLPRRPRKN